MVKEEKKDNSDFAIKINNLSKIYKLYDHPVDRLKESLNPFRKKYHKSFYALKDVSLEIKKGETVGIIGKNGAGKSTLLKILTGVITSTSGDLQINGRIAALLELGTGFNPQLTGIENVYFTGSIMGYSKKEMDGKIAEIESFADIGDYINQPVKMYSSGMFARLAFSVAINVDPDILIVDEVLSVGDTRFQAKSIKRMEEIRSNGTTILFVSHAMEQIKRFCASGIWLKESRVKMIGDADIITDKYIDSLRLENLVNKDFDEQKRIDKSSLISSIASVSLNKTNFKTFEDVIVTVKYEIYEKYLEGLLLGVAIFDNERNYIFGPNTYLDEYEIERTNGVHEVKYHLPRINLLAGTYFLDVGLFLNKGLVNLDFKMNAISFDIESKYFAEGRFFCEHFWEQKY